MENLSRAIIVLLLSFYVFSAQAASMPEMVINEIAWMGNGSSFTDEWIELYNNINSPINLKGWVLRSTDGTPKINLTGAIAANGFYLLERTNDETVPDIKADLIYKGSLSNRGEFLELIMASGETADQTNCSSGWFTGDNKTKRTMERKNPQISGNDSENWQTSQNPAGTPKIKNSPGAKLEERIEVGSLEEELAKTKAKKELAAISEQSPEPSNPLCVLLIAFPIAIFSGVIILLLKRKIKEG